METQGRPKRVFETLYEKKAKTSIALSHPKYRGRADRLDLITNRMVGIKAAVGDKNFTICDLSETGFSYAERVPVKKNLSYKQVKLKVDQIAVSNYGKNLKCVCFFEGEQAKGGVETNGTIRNHTLFLILTSDEIKRAVTSYLQSKAIRRSHDPQGYFGKLDTIMSKTESMRKEGYNENTLGIVLNATFQNLILEIGAPAEIFDKLYQGFIDKPVYVKYGVAVAARKEAFKLLKFATVRNAAVLKKADERQDNELSDRQKSIHRLNELFSFKDFVEIIWDNCLAYYKLDAQLTLPKIQKAEMAELLKQEKARFNGALQKMADPEYMEGDYHGLLSYLCEGLYWFLIEKDKKYFDREFIKKEIRSLVTESYEKCLRIEQRKN